MNQINEIVIHHGASPRSTTIEDIDRWHRAKGWNGCGYHYVIHYDGQVKVGRKIPQTGAHATPNSRRIGICVVGDNTDESHRWGPSQWASLVELVSTLLRAFPWIGPSGVLAHWDAASTKCPGLTADEWGDFLNAIEERL